jgi:hypothetical protein
LELESSVGHISTKQLLKDVQEIRKKAEQTREALKENKVEDSAE